MSHRTIAPGCGLCEAGGRYTHSAVQKRSIACGERQSHNSSENRILGIKGEFEAASY
jgi:hypothetical protein